jgi:hypothetical protein
MLGGDPSYFVVAGPPATNPSGVLPNLHVFPEGTYDGQYFYRLALEPWTGSLTAYGITFDAPVYRQERILYPLLAWAASLGNWQLVPWTLVAVNLIAVGVLAYTAAALAVCSRRAAFASVLVPFYPGYVATVVRDLGELTEAAALCTGILLTHHRRYGFAAAALTASALARESAIGVPIAGTLWWAVGRLRKQPPLGPPLKVWLLPIVAFVVWSRLLTYRWAAPDVLQGLINFAWPPLGGLLSGFSVLNGLHPDWRVDLGLLALVIAPVVFVIADFARRSDAAGPLHLACMLYAGLAIFYSAFVWRDEYAFPRALHEVFLTAALALLSANAWIVRLLTLPTLWLWVAFALRSSG